VIKIAKKNLNKNLLKNPLAFEPGTLTKIKSTTLSIDNKTTTIDLFYSGFSRFYFRGSLVFSL